MALSGRNGESRGVAPQPLELIKRAQRRMEYVHDEIDVIEEHPASLCQAFNRLGDGGNVFDSSGISHLMTLEPSADRKEEGTLELLPIPMPFWRSQGSPSCQPEDQIFSIWELLPKT